MKTTRAASHVPSPPWNKNRAVGQMQPFSADEAAHIRLQLAADARRDPRRRRDLALFNFAIDAMCRAGELLAIAVADVTDLTGAVVEEFDLLQSKTRRVKTVTLGPETRQALGDWIAQSGKAPSDLLWTSIGNRSPKSCAITRKQFSRLVKRWAEIARRDRRRFSTHSMRRTKSAAIYDETKNLRACQHLLGHQSIASTAEYLGVDRREALDIAKNIQI